MFVVELGISPDYVLHKMSMAEVRTLMRYAYKRHQEQWEQTRWLATVIVNMLSSKEVHETDLVHFLWDEDDKKQQTKPKPTADQIDDLLARARSHNKNNT